MQPALKSYATSARGGAKMVPSVSSKPSPKLSLVPAPEAQAPLAPAPPVSLPQLVARAQAGETAAFEQLVAVYQRRIYAFALAFAGNEAEARDLAQEALIKVYRSIGSYRFQASFATWLYAIVRHEFLDFQKSRAARERALCSPIEDEAERLYEAARAEEGLLRRDERRALWAALRRVPAAYRQVVVMFDVQGLAYDEIAQALGVPVGTVKSRLKRGRDALRSELFRGRAREEGGGER